MSFNNQVTTFDLNLNNPCYNVPPNVCIETTTYRKTITLPYRSSDYHLAYQRCCRNAIIDNIINPSNTGATYDIVISAAALIGCNSSPRFRDWPPFYLCQGNPIDYDNSAFMNCATLTMELLMLMATLHQILRTAHLIFLFYGHQGMVSIILLVGTDPFKIDSHTERLSGTSPNQGTFVLGICAKEYRSGVLIGYTKRDFQYTIGRCNKKVNANFTLSPVICRNNLTVNPLNFTQPSSRVSYSWNFGDSTNWILGTTPYVVLIWS